MGIAGRIFDRLKAYYGESAVFMDVTSNRPGYDYRGEIKSAMQNCEVVLAVIGLKWFGGGKRGHTRITSANDAVRSELETAFRLKKRIIPVLVEGARMPGADNLPDSLKELTFIHAAEVDAAQDFDFHIERLIGEIDALLAGSQAVPNSEVEHKKGSESLILAAPPSDPTEQVSPAEKAAVTPGIETSGHPAGRRIWVSRPR